MRPIKFRAVATGLFCVGLASVVGGAWAIVGEARAAVEREPTALALPALDRLVTRLAERPLRTARPE